MGIVGQDGGEGEQAGAGGDGRHAGRGEAQGQWGDRQGQALELGQVLHLKLLLERVNKLEIIFYLVPRMHHHCPDANTLMAVSSDCGLTRMMEFISGGVTCLALSMAPMTCC